MNFYRCWIKYLRESLLKGILINIPNNIDDKEIVVRGIVHSLMVKSNGNLKTSAVLPPPVPDDGFSDKKCKTDYQEVSVLRLNYTTINFCKKHTKSLQIPNNVYKGLAVFKASSIRQINNQGSFNTTEGILIKIALKYSPTLKLRMHSDIFYNITVVRGKPQTQVRLLAEEIMKCMRYFPDSNPESLYWTDGPIFVD